MPYPNAPVTIAEPPGASRTGLGIGLMILGFMFFSITDATAKFLTQDFPPLQIAWFRQLGLLSVGLWILATRGLPVLKTKRPVLQVLRGCAAAISASAFIFAVGYVPLADAVAVSFIAPFAVTILAALVLRETVGIRRWSAVTVGFIGTLIVIRPGLGILHPAIFVVVFAASMFAMRQILSRVLGPVDRTATTILYTAISSVALLTVPMVFVWQTPTSLQQVLLILLLAGAAGTGELLIIRALELAEAATLGPALKAQCMAGDDELRYALAYAQFRSGRHLEAERSLAGIGDPDLFAKASQLRKAMASCRADPNRCL